MGLEEEVVAQEEIRGQEHLEPQDKATQEEMAQTRLHILEEEAEDATHQEPTT